MDPIDYQKVIEDMTMQLNKQVGNTAYWQGMAGTYRNENHRNLQKIKKLKIITQVQTAVIVAMSILIVGVIIW